MPNTERNAQLRERIRAGSEELTLQELRTKLAAANELIKELGWVAGCAVAFSVSDLAPPGFKVHSPTKDRCRSALKRFETWKEQNS